MHSPSLAGSGGRKASIIGHTVTVKMVKASDEQSPKLSTHFADANEPGKVMFIHQPKPYYAACFGGLMATRAKGLGAAGIVVDGSFRDIQEIQDMELPLFARKQSILGSHTFTRASEVNVPVKFSRFSIQPDDIMVGDEDGVVAVQQQLVDKVVQICQERKEMDENIMNALQNGASMADAMAKFRR